jgi:predicted XRE-type DNA-binding protein
MSVKKIVNISALLQKTGVVLLLSFLFVSMGFAQLRKLTPAQEEKLRLKNERREKINQLIKQEEEGALIYQKQISQGIHFNTDGWSIFYEKGKYKSITKTNLWWIEVGEHKHPKEERTPTASAAQGFIILSNYIYGKRNNLYEVKFGAGQQKLIGGKGNKNGVAVSAIYGGGITAGLLKPYYLQIQNPSTQRQEDIKYDNNDQLFLDPTVILGKGSFSKGFGEMQIVPGGHVKGALRFDYGRYNEVVSALEVGLKATYFSKKMPIMLLNDEKSLFFNAYISVTFGKRK